MQRLGVSLAGLLGIRKLEASPPTHFLVTPFSKVIATSPPDVQTTTRRLPRRHAGLPPWPCACRWAMPPALLWEGWWGQDLAGGLSSS